MKSNEYFKASNLGFSYPKEYEAYVSLHKEFGELRWWFIGSSEGLFDIAYEMVNYELRSSVELFPFAKSSETNALACFDRAGKVYFVIGTGSLKNVDWSTRLTKSNVKDWYKGVLAGEF